jgi:tetratricopeptide (TPR) repeat protein
LIGNEVFFASTAGQAEVAFALVTLNSAPPPFEPFIDRLESWKEIAAYLRRDVRTVQRWERTHGLPIHRLPSGQRPTPFAYKHELDEWWQRTPTEGVSSRADLHVVEGAAAGQIEPVNSAKGQEPTAATLPDDIAQAEVLVSLDRSPLRKKLFIGSLAAMAVTASWVLWAFARHDLPFSTRQPILLAAIENRTGDDVFSGAIEAVLTRELSAYGNLTPVGPERIGDALRLMRRPIDTRLDRNTAVEVCRRDGSIRVVLASSIDRVGASYTIALDAIRAIPNETIATLVENANSREQVIPALRRLATRLRVALGDQQEVTRRDSDSLLKVTTPSLEALKLYSQADAAMRALGAHEDTAAELLRRATRVDPDFASAHILLAWALYRTRADDPLLPEAERSARRALELSETNCSEAERYFIRGSYFEMVRQSDEAIAAYEALLRIQPDHYWAINNLQDLLGQRGRLREAAPFIFASADLRPRSLFAQARALWFGGVLLPDAALAKRYLQRAQALEMGGLRETGVDLEDSDEFALIPWVEFFPAFLAWRAGRPTEASRILDSASADDALRFDVLEGRSRIRSIGQWYAALGRLSDAQRMFRREPEPFRTGDLMTLAILHENPGEIRSDFSEWISRLQHGEPYPRHTGVGISLLAFDGGTKPAAQALMSNTEIRELVLGIEALADHRYADAIPHLRKTWESERFDLDSLPLFAAETLSHAYLAAGQPSAAIAALEEARSERDRAYPIDWDGVFTVCWWLRTQDLLAELYRQQGRSEDARRIDVDLSNLLQLADADHPIVQRIRERERGVHTAAAPH